jgi:hypothetical protein
MRFIKRLALNKKDPANNRFAVEADDRIVTTSKVSLQLPTGTTLNRPSQVAEGQIRLNTSRNETEIFNSVGFDSNGNTWDSPWERVKTNRQANITAQNLGIGDYHNSLFGPLAYNINPEFPQNVLVFVDNVYQTPNTNYNLVLGTDYSDTVLLSLASNEGENILYLTTTTNVLVGQTVSSINSGIPSATTVTNIDYVGRAITISNNLTNTLSIGSPIDFSYQSGVLINFTSSVPNKPVLALLGFDGYYPPNN